MLTLRIKVCLFILVGFFVAPFVNGQDVAQSKKTLAFEGNRVFSEHDLLGVVEKCLSLGTRGQTTSDRETLEYCLSRLRDFLSAKGYLQATIGKPKEQMTADGPRWLVAITEGAPYRLGEVQINGAKLLLPSQIREMLDLKHGEIADGDRISMWLFERAARVYRNFGYIQFSAYVETSFKLIANATEGVVNLKVTIDEGDVFRVRSINFEGNGNVPPDVLLRELPLRTGDVFNQDLFNEGLKKINQTDQFEILDFDKDVDYKCDGKTPELDVTIRLKRKQ